MNNQCKIESVTVRNFYSYGNAPVTINFNKGTTFITGENLDDTTNGKGANGVGKTVIVNAVSYAFYGKPVTTIKSQDDLINFVNKQDMFVEVVFTKNNKRYEITRARKVKSSKPTGNWVRLMCDGVDVTPDSIANTNSEIESIIGLPYELFIRIVVFAATNVPFLDLPAKTATEVIENLFGFTDLSERADHLKVTIKETQVEIAKLETKIEQQKSEHTRHQQQLSNAKLRMDNWGTERDDDVVQMQQRLVKLQQIDTTEQYNILNEIKDIDQQSKDISSNVSIMNSERQVIQTEINQLTRAKNEKQKELDHLNDATCPYCNQSFIDTQDKIHECEQTIKTSDEGIAPLQEALDIVTTDIDELKKQQEELTLKKQNLKGDLKVNDVNTLDRMKDDITNLERKIEDLQAASNPFIEPYNELAEVELEEIDMEGLNEFKDDLEHQQFLLKLLTKKDSFVRKALLSRNLPFLNERLLQYVGELGLPHKVEFTPQLSAKISKFGRELGFSNLSSGQKARVNIALSFAFRDVLQMMHAPINLCILDEALDVGLDTIGVNAAAKFIKNKAKHDNLSMFIISHRDELSTAFESKLTVQMEKGFSTVIQ